MVKRRNILKEPSATVFRVNRYSILRHPQTWVHIYQTSDALYDLIYRRKDLKYDKLAEPTVLT